MGIVGIVNEVRTYDLDTHLSLHILENFPYKNLKSSHLDLQPYKLVQQILRTSLGMKIRVVYAKTRFINTITEL